MTNVYSGMLLFSRCKIFISSWRGTAWCVQISIELSRNRSQHPVVMEGGRSDLSEKLLHLNSHVVSLLMMW